MSARGFRVPYGILAAVTVFGGMLAIFALVIAVPLWLDADDDMIVSTLYGEVACNGNFPDLYPPSITPADARDLCVSVQSRESAKRTRFTIIGAVAGLLVYGSYRLAQRQGDA